MSDIVKRLNDHCVGHPYAKIEWPHRLLHDARDEIERLRKALRDVMNASNCPYEVAKNALAESPADRQMNKVAHD